MAPEGAVRTFQLMTESGWRDIEPHRLSVGDIFRVLDDGVPASLAPELDPDPGIYKAVQTAAEGVHFAVRLQSGTVLDKVAGFTA